MDPSFPTYREPLTQYPNLNGFSQFGFGRRTCQGIPVVEQDLFLTMGGLAWAFDIRKKRDRVTGEEQPVHWNDYTPLLIAKPARFPFDALPRSREKVVRMREMYEAARDQPGLDTGMDISPFRRDLGDRIYVDDVADREVDSSSSSTSSLDPLDAASSGSNSGSRSSSSDSSCCDDDGAPDPEEPDGLSLTDGSASTTPPSDIADPDAQRQKLEFVMGLPLDPRLGCSPEPSEERLHMPGAWSPA